MTKQLNVELELVVKEVTVKSKDGKEEIKTKKYLKGNTILDDLQVTLYVNPCKEKKKQTSPDYTMSYQIDGNRNFNQCGLLWNKTSKKNLNFKSGIFKYENKGYNIVIFKSTKDKNKFNATIDFDREIKPKSNVQQTTESSPF
jgi:hypothetical protein